MSRYLVQRCWWVTEATPPLFHIFKCQKRNWPFHSTTLRSTIITFRPFTNDEVEIEVVLISNGFASLPASPFCWIESNILAKQVFSIASSTVMHVIQDTCDSVLFQAFKLHCKILDLRIFVFIYGRSFSTTTLKRARRRSHAESAEKETPMPPLNARE